jgi:hypothetical protein
MIYKMTRASIVMGVVFNSRLVEGV